MKHSGKLLFGVFLITGLIVFTGCQGKQADTIIPGIDTPSNNETTNSENIKDINIPADEVAENALENGTTTATADDNKTIDSDKTTDDNKTTDGGKITDNDKTTGSDNTIDDNKTTDGNTTTDSNGAKNGETKNTVSEPVSTTPQVRTFNITATSWSFTPSSMTVNKGDTVKITITSIDVTHGFALPDYNIDETVEPGKPVTVEFVADKQGTFDFRCSVFCGEGHKEMEGILEVK
ncbi:cupredoxin domain-containing protein [Candidatus Peregrinibacteria bacterium]|nr:cupredoxin domain-containing protein [Candidatus Peregrinibacteria bacterium]